MEAKERMCASFVISCFQDEDFEEAKRVLPFNGGLEKGKEPRQIVQMHQSPSQVVMESASLGVIHQGNFTTGRKERAKIEPRNCQKKSTGKAAPQEKEAEGTTKERDRKENQHKTGTQHNTWSRKQKTLV